MVTKFEVGWKSALRGIITVAGFLSALAVVLQTEQIHTWHDLLSLKVLLAVVAALGVKGFASAATAQSVSVVP